MPQHGRRVVAELLPQALDARERGSDLASITCSAGCHEFSQCFPELFVGRRHRSQLTLDPRFCATRQRRWPESVVLRSHSNSWSVDLCVCLFVGPFNLKHSPYQR